MVNLVEKPTRRKEKELRHPRLVTFWETSEIVSVLETIRKDCGFRSLAEVIRYCIRFALTNGAFKLDEETHRMLKVISTIEKYSSKEAIRAAYLEALNKLKLEITNFIELLEHEGTTPSVKGLFERLKSEISELSSFPEALEKVNPVWELALKLASEKGLSRP